MNSHIDNPASFEIGNKSESDVKSMSEAKKSLGDRRKKRFAFLIITFAIIAGINSPLYYPFSIGSTVFFTFYEKL